MSEHDDRRFMRPPGFLVAISPSPYSRYLIQWTRKTALEQKAPWLAVYIQKVRELSAGENESLKKNMKLVNDLGAELIISLDDDVPGGIIRVARQHNVAHIVIGKPLGYKSSVFFKAADIIGELIKQSGEIDIFVVSEQSIRPVKQKLVPRLVSWFGAGSLREYTLVSFWMACLIGINLLLASYISYLSIGFIFLAAVAVVSSVYRRGPVLFFTALSAVLWNFMFIRPRFTFFIDHLEDILMFLMYFITAFIIGNLTTRLRVKESFLRKREKNLEELYQMSKMLNRTNGLDEIIRESTEFLRGVFSIEASAFFRNNDGTLSLHPFEGGDFKLSEKERDAALWCFENGKPAGEGTDSPITSACRHIPFLVQNIPAGVLAFKFKGGTSLSIEQENLLSALVSQISTAIERYEYHRTRQKIEIAEESEKLYRILLNSISHELRTPITTISTAAGGLTDRNLGENADVRTIFANDIIEASDRLNRIVDNLLGSLRIESQRITLNLEWYDISELVGAVYRKLEKQLKTHSFSSHIEKDLPMVKFDFVLMDQLLTNLLYNAVLHTRPGSEITLGIGLRGDILFITVDDNGTGVPEDEREKIFGKFYRKKTGKSGGLGLGLAICREIAEIHRGTIHVENNERGGARFMVELPLQQSDLRGELR